MLCRAEFDPQATRGAKFWSTTAFIYRENDRWTRSAIEFQAQRLPQKASDQKGNRRPQGQSPERLTFSAHFSHGLHKARGKLSSYVTGAVTANAPGYRTPTSHNKFAKIRTWLFKSRPAYRYQSRVRRRDPKCKTLCCSSIRRTLLRR